MATPFSFGSPSNTTQDARNDWFLRSLRRLENLENAPTLFGNLNLNTKLIFDSFTTPLTYGIRIDFTGTNAHIFDWGSYSGGNMTLQTSSSGSPSLNFYSSLSVPVVNQFLGGVYWFAQNSSNNWVEYAQITGNLVSPTAGATSAQLIFQVASKQTSTFPTFNAITIDGSMPVDALSNSRFIDIDGGANDYPALTVKTTSPSGFGPYINTYLNMATPANGMTCGGITAMGNRSDHVLDWYSNINFNAVTVTAGAMEGQVQFQIKNLGANINGLTLGVQSSGLALGNYGHLFNVGSGQFGTIQITGSSAGTGGPIFVIFQDSASPAANDFPSEIITLGRDSSNNIVRYSQQYTMITSPTAGAYAAQIQWIMPVAGANATRMILGGGLQIGSAPTGGDKGAGTINVSSGIFLNNASYTNPDYALEHYFTGRIERFAKNIGAADYKGITPLDEIESVLRDSCRLPGIHGEPMDIFARSDIVLEKLEEAYIYIVQLHKRVAELEARLLH